MNAIDFIDLKKQYPKGVSALSGINLSIGQGEFFGLLGPNGAGKSTLIHCLVGLCKISSGKILVFGKNNVSDYLFTKSMLGFSPQETNVDRFFNLKKTLEFQGGFYGLPRNEARSRASQLLEQFNLTSKSNEQFYRLSGGMQRRMLIARALMNKPKILILDEPTAGIDVEQRYELWQTLKDLNLDGTTILLTTHYIDEAEYLCKQVAFINHGLIIETGSPKALINKFCQASVAIELNEPMDPATLAELPFATISGKKINASGTSIGVMTEAIIAKVLQKSGRHVVDIQINQGSLEDVFVKATQINNRE